MHWRLRAALLRAMAGSRPGLRSYGWLQRRFGSHNRPATLRAKLGHFAELAGLLRENGRAIEGAEVLEVGTGWLPLLPLAFWICGARRVHSVDVHPHLDPALLRRASHWIADSETELLALWREIADADRVRERIAVVRSLRHEPLRLLERAGIVCRAPADAAATGLSPASVDVHYSLSVFEHVHPARIPGILAEAARLLSPTGLAVHWIDSSDHFSHFEPGLPRFHFLSLEEARWQRLAGNELAFHNRLRLPDFRALWEASPLELLSCRGRVDEAALAELAAGPPLAEPFRDTDPRTLATERIQLIARRAGA